MYAVITQIRKDDEWLPPICVFHETIDEAREALKMAFVREGYQNLYGIVFGTKNIAWLVKGDDNWQNWVHEPTGNEFDVRIWTHVN